MQICKLLKILSLSLALISIPALCDGPAPQEEGAEEIASFVHKNKKADKDTVIEDKSLEQDTFESSASSATLTHATRTNLSAVEPNRLGAAMGHFGRARALLNAAVREFDAGLKISSPKPLLDPNSWRNGVIAKARDLEPVLSPQPHPAVGGVRYEADTRLLNDATQ